MTTQALTIALLLLLVILPFAAFGVLAIRWSRLLWRDGDRFEACMAIVGGVVCFLGAAVIVMLIVKDPPGGSNTPAEASATVVHKNCSCTCDEK